MSEYLSKKAVLEWLESEMSINKGHPDDIDIHWTLNRVSKKIQSGAFDADESEGTWKATSEFAFRLNDHLDAEVQRLRAAAIKLHETINSFWQGDCDKSAVVNAQSNLCDTLSTTTEPTGAERVSLCMECDSGKGA